MAKPLFPRRQGVECGVRQKSFVLLFMGAGGLSEDGNGVRFVLSRSCLRRWCVVMFEGRYCMRPGILGCLVFGGNRLPSQRDSGVFSVFGAIGHFS